MPLKTQENRAIAIWLFACAGLVALMMIVGAITRLSESGLSMVEWRPLMGALPPLSEAEWERVYGLYKNSPQYQKVHFWMELSDFKRIFFWEWFHRLLGRLIGLAYALPLLWFWMRKQIPDGYRFKLFGLFILGGLQGLMGWYMVKSGLVDVPAVSHFRLAAHLSLAFLVFSLLYLLGLGFFGAGRAPQKRLFRHGLVVLFFVCVTILWGAFTAGLDAGLVYNDSFPLMGGQWIPPDMWFQQPAWINVFENPVSVQFTHRWLAIFTAFMVWGFCGYAFYKGWKQAIIYALAAAVFLQLGLGISTLLSGVSLWLAVMHQAGALLVLILLLSCLYQLRQPD